LAGRIADHLVGAPVTALMDDLTREVRAFAVRYAAHYQHFELQ
jgi:hypothetical protein